MNQAPSHIRFQNIRLDPSRALEPARKKLSTLEAQRIMAVFDETIRRVEVVTLLPYLMQNMDRYRVSLGSEIVELLNHHAVIISSYDDIRHQLDSQLERRAAQRKAQEEEEARLAAEGKPHAFVFFLCFTCLQCTCWLELKQLTDLVVKILKPYVLFTIHQ
jgi:hypothetical protein